MGNRLVLLRGVCRGRAGRRAEGVFDGAINGEGWEGTLERRYTLHLLSWDVWAQAGWRAEGVCGYLLSRRGGDFAEAVLASISFWGGQDGGWKRGCDGGSCYFIHAKEGNLLWRYSTCTPSFVLGSLPGKLLHCVAGRGEGDERQEALCDE